MTIVRRNVDGSDRRVEKRLLDCAVS